MAFTVTPSTLPCPVCGGIVDRRPGAETGESRRPTRRVYCSEICQRQASQARRNERRADPGTDGIYVASGFGIEVKVKSGHLVVCDGIAEDRRETRFSRVTSRLRRLVVIGRTGYVSLDALDWLRGIQATFVQIDRDGSLIAMSVDPAAGKADVRRAQALAAGTEVGERIATNLLRTKLARQIDLVERRLDAPEALATMRACARDLGGDSVSLRLYESQAARLYWNAWARVPLSFESGFAVPDHWRTAGPRTSVVNFKDARKAATPAHAIFNYVYAILETEAVIACHTVGLDPGLGIVHADSRYRDSMALDLMEPVRPVADGKVLDLLESRRFRRGEVLETREGVCRLGVSLARELAGVAAPLREAVMAVARDVALALKPAQRTGGRAARSGPRRPL